MSSTVKAAPKPCASCPYRRDVPEGVWHPEEYSKLRAYDGSTGEQSPRLRAQGDSRRTEEGRPEVSKHNCDNCGTDTENEPITLCDECEFVDVANEQAAPA